MGASIKEGMDLAVGRTSGDDGPPPYRGRFEVVGLWNFRFMEKKDPRATEDFSHLLFEDLRVREQRAVNHSIRAHQMVVSASNCLRRSQLSYRGHFTVPSRVSEVFPWNVYAEASRCPSPQAGNAKWN
jgi:hypothetical protein